MKTALLALCLVATVAEARQSENLSAAARTQRSRAHFDLGRAHLDLGEYDLALREFQVAYDYKPLPLFLYNIAQVARVSARREMAIEYFQKFLDVDPNARERPEVQKLLAQLRNKRLALVPAPRGNLPQPSSLAAAASSLPDAPAPKPEQPPPSAAPAAALTFPVDEPPPPPPPPRHRRLWIALGVVSVAVLAGAITAVAITNASGSTPSAIPAGYSNWGTINAGPGH